MVKSNLLEEQKGNIINYLLDYFVTADIFFSPLLFFKLLKGKTFSHAQNAFLSHFFFLLNFANAFHQGL